LWARDEAGGASVIVLAGINLHLDVRLWIALGVIAGFTLALQSLLLAGLLGALWAQSVRLKVGPYIGVICDSGKTP
jgi:hypothetical protein